jgi:hypothetical protein
MSSESVCQFARSWVDVGSFQTRLVVRFIIFTVSVRNILDKSSCAVIEMAVGKSYSRRERITQAEIDVRSALLIMLKITIK